MNIKNISIIIAVIFFCAIGKSQNRFDMVISEQNTLQPIFDALVHAGALCYGYYDTGNGAEWSMDIDDVQINLVMAGDHNLELAVEASFYKDFDWLNAIFSSNIDKTIDVDANLYSSYDVVTGEFLLKLEIVDIDISDFPDWIEDLAFFYLRYEDLHILNLIELYPELNAYYFSNPVISVTNDDIIVSVYLNYDITVANRSVENPTGHLTGTLSLKNKTATELTQSNIPSPSFVLARLNDQYIATTHNITIGGERHWGWTNNVDHKLITDQFQLSNQFFTDGLTAWFKEQEQVSIVTNIDASASVDLQYHDPWYVQIEEALYQPDNFRSITPGQYNVFLDQYPDQGASYTLRAPGYFATTDAIYAFSHWSVSPSGSATITHSSQRSSPVVFHSGGANIQAHYNNQVNNQPGTYIIEPGDKLTIPENAFISFKSTNNLQENEYFLSDDYDDNDGFTLVVDGELNIGKGVTLKGDGNGYWGGISLGPDGSVLMGKEMKIQDAFVGFRLTGSGDNDNYSELKNCVFENNLVGVWNLISYTPDNCSYGDDLVEITNCTFVDNTYSIYTDSFLDGTEPCHDPNADGSQDLILTNNLFSNTTVAPLVLNQQGSTYNWFHNTQVYYGQYMDASNIFEGSDPLFVNRENSDFSLQPSSPCIDAGNPNSPLDPDGTIADIGAFPFLHYSGEVTGALADGSVIMGEVLFSGDVWLPANALVTIAPNTNISFLPEASLDIQGTLTSDGTDGSISFDLNGSSILVSGEAAFVNTSFSNGILKYEGEQSSGSVYASSFTDASLVMNEGAFAEVRNTSFTGGAVGLMTSGINTSPKITNCTFTDHDIAIRANYHSSPIIRGCTIANSGVGLEAMYSSVPNLTNGISTMRSCNHTNNVIKNCQVAVHTWHLSSPNLGHGPHRIKPDLPLSFSLLGYNSLYSNEVQFHNQGSTIYAIGNNWSLQSCSFTGPFGFDEEPAPNVIWSPVLAELVPSPEIANIDELFHKASKLEAAGDFEEALDLYFQVVTAVPNEKPGELSLYGLARCYKALGQEEAMIQSLVSIYGQYPGTGVHKHAHSLLSSHKIKDGELALLIEAEGHIHTIRTEYPNNEMEPKLLYEEFLIAKKRGNNPLGRTTAGNDVSLSTKEVYRELKENYPDSPFTFLAGLESGNSKKTTATPSVPTSFTLYPAYPNPFNPTTTIRLDAVETLHATSLHIYDITGRMVETLLNEPIAPGTHEITWNAETSSTGVYFIVLTNGNEQYVQKIVLMK